MLSSCTANYCFYSDSVSCFDCPFSLSTQSKSNLLPNGKKRKTPLKKQSENLDLFGGA